MVSVVVGGAVANTARRGGDTWHRLHWLLGLRRLGVCVHLVEQIDPEVCVDADGQIVEPERSENLAYFKRVLARFGMSAAATLVVGRGTTVYGLPPDDLRHRLDDADLLVNISGHLDWKRLGVQPRRTIFVDEDPGFTQIWHVTGSGRRLDGYDAYYSVGANVGTSDCGIPAGGISWRPLRPFAVLDEWPVVCPQEFDRFTTVGGWRGPYGRVSYGGRTYGLKAHEFRKFASLPRHVPHTFELALDIHPEERPDLDLLRQGGWRLVDPQEVAGDPLLFREYLQGSSAEFSVAKGVYVETHSGWFSDRTIRYLATGRPAVVQDTGFGRRYSMGEGLLVFRTMQEAIDGANGVARHYREHCEAARAVAEIHFDSDKVLSRFLDEVLTQ